MADEYVSNPMAKDAAKGGAKDVGPTPIYKGFVNRCLRERGYEVVGWQ